MMTRISHWLTRAGHSALAFPLAVLVSALMLLISEMAYRGAEGQLSTAVTMGQARLKLLNLQRLLTEAESGQRGYLLTGLPDYLQALQAARAQGPVLLTQLADQLQATRMAEAERWRMALASDVDRKLSEMTEVVRLYEAGQQQRAMDLMGSGLGRDQMDSIRQQVEGLLDVANGRIRTVLEQIFEAMMLSRLGVAAMTLLSLLLLALFLRQAKLLAAHQRNQRRQLLAERDQLESEVSRRTAELTELARHLQTAREDERAHLARDLHDELGALLTAAKLDVARIRPALQKLGPELIPRLTHLTDTLNSGIALKRRIIEDLRPSTLDSLGLAAALEVLCTESTDRMGIPVRLDQRPLKLSRSAELTVFRMVQEALTNAAKHARATQIQVRVFPDGDHATVSVTDNGVGFEPGPTSQPAHGLLGMRYRLASEQGVLQVRSAPGQGTSLHAQLPLLAETASAALEEAAPDAASDAASDTA